MRIVSKDAGHNNFCNKLTRRRVIGKEWKDVALMEMEAYFGLYILCGVFKDSNESVIESLIHRADVYYT